MTTRFAVLALSSLLALPLLAACQTTTTAPAEAPPPFDQGTAAAMLTRTLQAQERGDLAAVQADLFPRNPNTLAACGKSRMAFAKPASIGMGEEAGGAPAGVTGVTLSNVQPQGNAYRATYQAQGNAMFAGSEMFVFANGRWWIKCQM